MAKLTNDSNKQTYLYHQLTIHNSHDSEDDFRSGCRNVSHCQQQQFFSDTPGFKPFTVRVIQLCQNWRSTIRFQGIAKDMIQHLGQNQNINDAETTSAAFSYDRRKITPPPKKLT